MLPTMLDTEFYRIDPNNLYEIQFTKEVTKLKEKPYRTACKNYEELLKGRRKNAPKSRNECVNLCILEKSLKSQNDSDGEMNCVHYHNVVSRFMLNYHNEELNANNAKFCTSLTYLNYVEFTKIRSNCYEYCNRDCIEENYKTTIDVSTIDDNHKNDPFNPNNHTIMNRTINHHKQQHAKSMIIIWPNREMYQEVEHEGELNFFELIGCLGGHAHIWLGLSIIQFYDVFAKIISCIRYRWELIGDKFRSLRRFCHRKKVHQSSNHSNNNPQ